MSGTLERIQRAIDFVEAHLFEDLPLTAVAERRGCSPWHFHRLFVALTGETPAGYRHVPAPDFELYDPERWDPATGEGDVDLYVPIADD